MQHHSELLNYLASLVDAKSYLEIGTFNREHNFNLINVADKMCVDPDPKADAIFCGTSDEYFKFFRRKFDILFIDGLHEHDQVRKDFENALRCLNDHGFIVLHDCNPYKEEITHYPRDSREWCGDVFKFAMTLGEYDGIDFCTVDFDYGCSVVWKEATKKGKKINAVPSWETFVANKDLMRLVSVEEFMRMFVLPAVV